MKQLWRIFILFLLQVMVLGAQPLLNYSSVGWTPKGEKWMTWESENFRIHALQRHENWVKHVALEAELAHDEMIQQFLWKPKHKTEIVLNDDYDISNGWASVYPFAQVRLFLSPPNSFNTLEAYDDWLRLLLRHEYTHILHLDQASGAPKVMQNIFGRVYFFFPHYFQPLWMIEGLAMDQETDFESGVGRGQSTLMQTRMRAEVQGKGPASLGRVSGYNNDWPRDQAYMYGVFFIEFLKERVGEEAVTNWLQVYRNKLIPYLMNPSARRAFGASYPALWSEYQLWLFEKFQKRNDAESPGIGIVVDGLFDAPPIVGADDKIYRVAYSGHSKAWMMRYDLDGKAQKVVSVAYPGVFDVNRAGEIVMSSLRVRYDNRLESDLYRWKSKEGWRRLTYKKRFQEARWMDDGSIIAHRIEDGISELVHLTHDGDEIKSLWHGEAGDVLGSFVVSSKDHKIVASIKKPRQSGWHLAQFDLNSLEWVFLTSNGNIQGQPSLSMDGESVLFSADYDGFFDIFSLNLTTLELKRLHRSATGAFTPVQTKDGAIWYQYYDESGYNLYRLDSYSQEPAPEQKVPYTPTKVPSLDLKLQSSSYSPWKTLRPRWWLPVAGIGKESYQIGVETSGVDALGRHQYQVLGAYENMSNSLFGNISYMQDNRYMIYVQRKLSYTYEDNDDIRYIRAEDSLNLSRLNLLSMLDDQMSFSLGVFHERNHDIYNATGVSSRSDFRRSLVGASLHFDNSKRYLYSISPASGNSLRLIAQSHDYLGDDFSGRVLELDWTGYLHLGNSHVLATRVVGVDSAEQAVPLRLGGEEPVYTVFGRNRYMLRGYRDNQLYADQFGLISAQWRYPLARIQKNWGVYPLGMRDIYGQIFVDHAKILKGPDTQTSGNSYTGIGTEVTLELTVGYYMLLPIVFGAAYGLDDDFGQQRYWMRIGFSF